MQKRCLVLSVSASFLWLLLLTPMAIGDTLDQSNTGPCGVAFYDVFGGVSFPSSPGPRGAAQTFTAGLSGSLTRVDVGITYAATGTINILILATSAGAPTSTVLGSATVAPSQLSGCQAPLLSVVFVQPIQVAAGQQYAIATFSESQWHGAYEYAQDYPGGHAYRTLDGTNWGIDSIQAPIDWYFQTYVNPVPEPGTMLLLGTGLAGLLARVRRPRP